MQAIKSIHLMALCVLVLSGLAIHQAMKAPSIGADSFGSGTAPMFVALILIALAIAAVVEDASGHRRAAEDAAIAISETGSSPFVKGTLLAAALVVYVTLLETTNIAFWVLSLVFMAIAARIIEGQLHIWLKLSLVTSAVLAISIELVFAQFLHVDLP